MFDVEPIGPIPRPLPDAEAASVRFDALYRAEFVKLAGALRLLSGESTTADDVAQETFVRAWERWDRVDSLEQPAGWLYVTAFRMIRRRLGRERRRPALEQGSVGRPGAHDSSVGDDDGATDGSCWSEHWRRCRCGNAKP